VTAGTLFDHHRSPLTVWFELVWQFVTHRGGVSALEVQRQLEIGSYRTAWAMCHRLRSVLIAPDQERLAGRVEVDETFFGGPDKELAGGLARGEKTLVAIAVEVEGPAVGRVCMQVVDDGSPDTLSRFVAEHVEKGSVVAVDDRRGCTCLAEMGYTHQVCHHAAMPGDDADNDDGLLPGPEKVAAWSKRWLMSTHHGDLSPGHLQAYLDEFAFRFNNRRCASRGLLFLHVLEAAVTHDPVRYGDVVSGLRAAPTPVSRSLDGVHPTLESRPGSERPWRRISPGFTPVS